MGTGWVWKRVSEKSPAKKTVSCLSGRLPRGVFKSQSETPPVWKVEKERNRSMCKGPERNGLTLSCPSHAGCRGRAGLKKQRQLEMGSCGKTSLLPENSSPVSLAHASEEFSAKHFEFHSKPAKSMGITLVFSVFWTESFQNK